MDGKLFIVGFISFFMGVFIVGQVFALTSTEKNIIQSEQEFYFDKENKYYSDTSNPDLIVNTYEAPCKGYFIVEENDTEYKSTGFGPLSDNYTFTQTKYVEKETIPTTTATGTVTKPSL
jgi:hypothetical protein